MRLPNRKPGKYTFPEFDPHVTQAELDAMRAKLHQLKTVARPRAVKQTREFAANGDFSENAEYQIAKGRLRSINRRIDELEYRIPRAIVIEAPASAATVQIGHTVILQAPDGVSVRWRILGPSESDPSAGTISYRSPIGQAVLGRSVGETATVTLPDRTVRYTIVTIE